MNSRRMVAQLSLFIVVMFGIRITSQAQCFGIDTVPKQYVAILRMGGDDVFTYSNSYVEGAYRNNWTCTTTMSEFKDGATFQGRINISASASCDNDNVGALLRYIDHPSQFGPGVLKVNSSNVSVCNDGTVHTFTASDTNQYPVVKPTIADPGVTGVWWLGLVGAHDANNGYYPSAGFKATKNCLTGDACGAGHWEITNNDGGGSLSQNTETGTSIIVTASAPNRIPGGMIIRFDLDGFASEPRTFTVGTPYRLALGAVIDTRFENDDPQDPGVGWETSINYTIIDRFDFTLAPIAYNESCGGCIDTGVNDLGSDIAAIDNNWPWKTVVERAVSDPGGRIVDVKRFLDTYVSNPDPAPVAPTDEPAASTLIDQRQQIWKIGNATAGVGVRVQINTLNRYRGRAKPIGITTPSDPF